MFTNRSVTKLSDKALMQKINACRLSHECLDKDSGLSKRLAVYVAEAHRRHLRIVYESHVVPSHVKGRLSK